MPLPVAHGLLGASIVAALHRQPLRRYAAPLVLGAMLAVAADVDFLLVFAFHAKAWHRGFSHSLALGLFVFLGLVWSLGKQRVREAIAFGLAFVSHGILDYLTTREGAGIELLWPFSGERFVFGWWGLSEMPSQLPAVGIVKALVVEFALFAPVLFLALLLRGNLARRSALAAKESA